MKIKRTVVMILSLVLLVSLTSCAETPFRIHIVANSDERADQEVKLLVRDAVMQELDRELSSWQNANDALEYSQNYAHELEQTACDVLAENGFTYTAVVEAGNFEFPEKKSGDLTYAEGNYPALRIVLGEGKGENWWSVLFSNLSVVNVESEESPEVRSWLYDIFVGYEDNINN